MKIIKIIIILILILILYSKDCYAQEFLYILNDDCIDFLYSDAVKYFKKFSNFEVLKDPRGILLRFRIENPCTEFNRISTTTYKNILAAEYFLAKIKNPAIIEVHTGKASCREQTNLKNWELSTVIANNIESIVLTPAGMLSRKRISSVGYGEFLPPKNTPNNGSKYLNRVDIIILCNVSGE